MHWASEEIGKPWVAQEHDCWAFFRRVQRERYGREVPDFPVNAASTLACAHAVDENPERWRWHPVTDPADGDAVLMGKGRHFTHVGTWVEADGGGVLHCLQGVGVVFQTRKALDLSGWVNCVVYRRHS